MLLAANRIVLQFPLRWYSTPPPLQKGQDAVLTRMVHLAFDSEGQRLRGKPVLLTVTAGSRADAHRRGGANLMPPADLLAPLRVSANRCGLVMAEPFLLHEADELTAAERDATAADHAWALTRWIDVTTPAEV
ncbi:NAD(P)H-dependent oxidoreductase [Paracoccus sp. ME4]|uniref:NAD(P)H-dependent oxidoreductase n=1 Tax=Paracoccus sp. ME4 TaxID=3138066 RepID=UPI00398AF2E5